MNCNCQFLAKQAERHQQPPARRHLSGVFVMARCPPSSWGRAWPRRWPGALLYIGQTHDAVLGGSPCLRWRWAWRAAAADRQLGRRIAAQSRRVDGSGEEFLWRDAAGAGDLDRPAAAADRRANAAWAALLIFSGIYLRALDTLPHNASGWHRLSKGVGLIALLLGVAYLVGALSGARDLLRPLGNIGRAEAQAPATPQFSRVRDIAELDRRIAQARGQTVMLDFYADWCVSCKEMERFTFADAAVQADSSRCCCCKRTSPPTAKPIRPCSNAMDCTARPPSCFSTHKAGSWAIFA